MKSLYQICFIFTAFFLVGKVGVMAQCAAPTAGNNSSCGASNMTLTASTQVANSAGLVHRWYENPTGGFPMSGPVQQPAGGTLVVSTYTADFSQTTTYYVSTYNSNTGCESGRTPITATVTAALSVSVSNASLCYSGQAYLEVSGAPNGSTITWVNSSNVQVGTGASYTTPVLSSTTYYTVTVSAPGYCTVSKTANVTVYPAYPLPTVSSNTVCPGQQATLTASGAPNGSLYFWYDAAGNLLQSPSTNNTYTTAALNTNTTYYVAYLLTSAPNCTSGRVAVNALVGLPNPPNALGATACSGSSLTLTASGLPSGGTYKWYDAANNLLQNSASSTFTTSNLTTTTTYYVAIYTSV